MTRRFDTVIEMRNIIFYTFAANYQVIDRNDDGSLAGAVQRYDHVFLQATDLSADFSAGNRPISDLIGDALKCIVMKFVRSFVHRASRTMISRFTVRRKAAAQFWREESGRFTAGDRCRLLRRSI